MWIRSNKRASRWPAGLIWWHNLFKLHTAGVFSDKSTLTYFLCLNLKFDAFGLTLFYRCLFLLCLENIYCRSVIKQAIIIIFVVHTSDPTHVTSTDIYIYIYIYTCWNIILRHWHGAGGGRFLRYYFFPLRIRVFLFKIHCLNVHLYVFLNHTI
jgi:hypothetical protein